MPAVGVQSKRASVSRCRSCKGGSRRAGDSELSDRQRQDAATTPGDDRIPLLLEICEDYFAHIGPNGYYEVDALLRGHDITGGPGWLIDMLALTRRRLQDGTRTPAH
jgi:hypothetical protein